MNHGGNVWRGESPGQWLDFSANIRPSGPPDWVKQALSGALDQARYYPDPDMNRARVALGAYLGLPAEYVLPTAGGISAIDLAVSLPGTGVFQFTPCFSEYAQRCKTQGKTIRNIPLLLEGHTIADPADQAANRLFEGCTVWLCNPFNPIGCAFTTEQIKRLLSLAEEKQGWLVVDEAFMAYCPEHTAVPLIQDHPRLIVAGSMTKILGIPGVRLGYLFGQPQVIQQLRSRQMTWELNCFAEAVLRELPLQ